MKYLKLGQLEKSTAIPGLNRNDAYSLRIILPPLPEQHRIVAKIEELFSEPDNGVENLKKAQQQLKDWQQSVIAWDAQGWKGKKSAKPKSPKNSLLLLKQN